MQLELVRLATVYFDRDPQEWKSWAATLGPVRLETQGYWELEEQYRVLIEGRVELGAPLVIDGEGVVAIPEVPRETIEEAIELMANAIAVAKTARRSISSPHPFVALVPIDDEAKGWLGRASGFAHSLQPVVQQVAAVKNFEGLLDLVAERREGVQLLAAALSQDQLTGRYHDLLRVFERAFARKAGALKVPLNRFYADSRFRFTPREVAHWIDIRPRLAHADRERTPPFALEADVRPFIARMELGAYDVLFNKDTWRDPGSERTNRWIPTEGTDAANHVFLTQGVLPPPLVTQLLDPFSRYPADLSAGLTELPAGWWSKNVAPKTDSDVADGGPATGSHTVVND